MLLNIYFYFFVNTNGYPVDIQKLCGYSHNGYSMDMSTGTGQVFIQRVGYGGATTRTLSTPLTSLLLTPKRVGPGIVVSQKILQPFLGINYGYSNYPLEW